jgi:hypothetical protein
MLCINPAALLNDKHFYVVVGVDAPRYDTIGPPFMVLWREDFVHGT